MTRPNIAILCMALGLSLAACSPSGVKPVSVKPVDPCVVVKHPTEQQQIACINEQFDALQRAIDTTFPNEPTK